MLTMQEILEIVDDNGFDNFGHDGWEYRDTTFERAIAYWGEDGGEPEIYSLADLACNKSFLEALSLVKCGKPMYFGHLQDALIRKITSNVGKDFAKICSQFIDKK